MERGIIPRPAIPGSATGHCRSLIYRQMLLLLLLLLRVLVLTQFCRQAIMSTCESIAFLHRDKLDRIGTQVQSHPCHDFLRSSRHSDPISLYTDLWSLEVLREAAWGIRRTMMKRIRQRQLAFLGHVMRMRSLENFTVIGRREGRRARGTRD